MSEWPQIPLGEIADIDYGVTASASRDPTGRKFLRITDIQDGSVDWKTVPWCSCTGRQAADGRLQNGDIVFARTGATTGKSFLIRDCPKDAVFASYLIRVRLGDRADAGFVSHFFQTHDYWSQVTKGARGVAQPGVNATTLKSLRIPMPPHSDQRRIAEILDKVDALRTKRRAALTQLDGLTQAIFLDMFGDPVTNSKGYPTSTIGGVCEQVTDGEHLTPKRTQDGIKLLSARNIRDGYIDFQNVDYIGREEHERIKRRCNPSRGDILISCSGTIGRVACVETDEAFSLVRSAALIRPTRSIVRTKFLEQLLRTPVLKARMMRRANASSQANLFQGQIRELPVYLPGLEVQDRFVNRASGVSRLNGCLSAFLEELDVLFASLQHRAFRGEL